MNLLRRILRHATQPPREARRCYICRDRSTLAIRVRRRGDVLVIGACPEHQQTVTAYARTWITDRRVESSTMEEEP